MGGGGDDWMYGSYGDYDGASGKDRMLGGPGTDNISGNYGPDKIVGGPAPDYLHGDEDNDIIDASDGVADHAISCGSGTDTVYFDSGLDRVNPISCEKRIGE